MLAICVSLVGGFGDRYTKRGYGNLCLSMSTLCDLGVQNSFRKMDSCSLLCFWFDALGFDTMSDLRSLHFDVQIISRGQSKSAVASASYRSGKRLKANAPMRSALAAASYRSGQTLYSERRQKTFDYTRKEDVRHSEILAPRNAPAWVKDRQTLWNTVEALEKRKDAQLARDVIAVFPHQEL